MTGAGAGFALEDSYVLSQAVAWAYERKHSISRGLGLYDRVRSPHYKAMYDILDDFRRSDAELEKLGLSFDEAVAHTIRDKWGTEFSWIYSYDVCSWAYWLEDADQRTLGAGGMGEGCS